METAQDSLIVPRGVARKWAAWDGVCLRRRQVPADAENELQGNSKGVAQFQFNLNFNFSIGLMAILFEIIYE